MDTEPVDQGEWQKHSGGSLRREGNSPFGMSRLEKVNPNIGQKTTYDQSPDAYRVIHSWDEASPFNPVLQKIFQERANKIFSSNHMNFLDKGKRLLMGVIVRGKANIIVNLIPDVDDESNLSSSAPANQELEALISAKYDAKDLTNCTVRVESSLEKWELEETDMVSMLGYIRTNDVDALVNMRSVTEEGLDELLDRDYEGRKDHPRVLEARELAHQLTEEALQGVPFEDRDEAESVLDNLGWETQLISDLLMSARSYPSVAKFLEEEGRKQFLQKEINGQSQILSASDQSNSVLDLDLNNFSDEGFSWQEVEVDNLGNKTEELAKDHPSAEARRIMKQGDIQYGKEIPVLQNVFTIEKNGENLIVTCLLRGKIQWRASIPQSVPVEEITSLASDPDKDFRSVRSMLPISLDET